MAFMDFTEECVMFVKNTVSDGFGGMKVEFEEYFGFDAAIALAGARESRTGDSETPAARYSVLAEKGLLIKYDDIFRREKNGELLRVTSLTPENAAPHFSRLNLMIFYAERVNGADYDD